MLPFCVSSSETTVESAFGELLPIPLDTPTGRMVAFRQLTEAPDDDVMNLMSVTHDDVLE